MTASGVGSDTWNLVPAGTAPASRSRAKRPYDSIAAEAYPSGGSAMVAGSTPSAMRRPRASMPAGNGMGSSPIRSMPSAWPMTSGWNMIQWNRLPTSPSGMRRRRSPSSSAAVRIVVSASSKFTLPTRRAPWGCVMPSE